MGEEELNGPSLKDVLIVGGWFLSIAITFSAAFFSVVFVSFGWSAVAVIGAFAAYTLTKMMGDDDDDDDEFIFRRY